jgi:hypothetical protein
MYTGNTLLEWFVSYGKPLCMALKKHNYGRIALLFAPAVILGEAEEPAIALSSQSWKPTTSSDLVWP